MADIKISELSETTDLNGLYTMGTDKNNLSKKVALQFVKDAADYANAQGDYAKQAGDTVNGNVGVSDYPEFSASQSYVIGDIVRYNGVLYAFTANHAASAWNGSDVKATSINAITSGKLAELESEVKKNIKPIVINGNVTNAPDEEDLTSEDNLLKLKDRAAFDGMGYIILRKNKTFVEQVTLSNTIYEIRYDFDFTKGNSGFFSMPENCILFFNGGCLRNANIEERLKIVSANNEFLENSSLNLSNAVIYANWWKFTSDAANNSMVLQSIFDTAYKSDGATIQFGNESISFSETIYIKTKTDNTYIGNHIIVKGVSNEIATINYIGTEKGICVVSEDNPDYGGVVSFESIGLKAPNAEYLIYLNRASSLSFKRVSFKAPQGTCLYANDLWVWRMEDCFIEGKIGIYIGAGTSAYISNLYMSCTELGLRLNSNYVRIDNIFGDYAVGTFCLFRYCTVAISSIATESDQLNEFIRAEYSQLVIDNIHYKSPKKDASVFSGNNSSILVTNLIIADNSDTPRGYLNTGTYALRVVVDRFYSPRVLQDNSASLNSTCGTTIKYFARTNFAWELPDKAGSSWMRSIDGVSLEQSDFVDGYVEKPLYPKTRVLVGMQDTTTAVKNNYNNDGTISGVGESKKDVSLLHNDDIFLNSRATAGFPYFAWVVKNKVSTFNDSQYDFVPFLTAFNGVDKGATMPNYQIGHPIFDTKTGLPYWVGANQKAICPVAIKKELLPWYNSRAADVHYFVIGKAGSASFNAKIRHLCGMIVMYFGGENDGQVYTSIFIEVNSSKSRNTAVMRNVVAQDLNQYTFPKFSVVTIQKDGVNYVAIKYSCNSKTLDSIQFMGIVEGYEGEFTDIYDGSATEIETLAMPEVVGKTTERNTTLRKGDMFFDTTLNKPIWWTGSKWVDSTGTQV